MYKFTIEQIAVSCPEISRWCLDYPREEDMVSLTDLETDGVLFQGWVIPEIPAMVSPFVRVQGERRYFDLNVDRPDVVQKILLQDTENHPLLRCGFRFRAPLEARDVIFGFRVGDRDLDYVRLRVDGELKVLEGLEGWLFLDNDTNRSVEQFTGELLIDRPGCKNWSAYLAGFANAAAALDFRHAVLIAPAKEMALAGYYPFKKGRSTPVDQVLKIAQERHRVIYPVATLESSQERAFRVTDTHWTPYGAMLTVTDVSESLGIDREQVQEVFARDRYKEREIAGDLGNKFYPRRTSAEKILISYSYQKHVVYDNHLPNFGRVILIANREALLPRKCVIFGSSSSYSTLPYFSRIFSEVVLVHSAGNVDMDVLRHEAPHYVIAQTNGRFVIRPPVVGYSLSAAITEKLAALPDGNRREVLHKTHQWLGKSDTQQIRYYHDML
jgi:alginate O-acetyltransferase complex protein AlgJ